MTQTLRKDPIVEAVCEFRLRAPDWDWTVPGVVYRSIKDRFPRKAEAPQIDFEIADTDEGVHSSAQKSIGRLQFWASNNTQLVQIGPGHFSVHQLKPYSGWPKFKVLIEEVLRDYENEAPFEAITAMSLRYTNRLPYPVTRMKIEEMLRTVPQIPDSEDQIWASWFQQVEIFQPHNHAILGVRSGYLPTAEAPQAPGSPAPSVPAEPHMMLDLLFSHQSLQPIAREGVSQWLDTAHGEIETLFFNSLQPKYLQEFEPEVNHENDEMA